MEQLLSRDEFRETVLKRNNFTCCFCKEIAVDAHHIIERRLWPDGGYYLSNGAGVCERHHLACESTNISVEQVREACGITKPIIPPHLYQDQPYDKWGNPIMPNGQRLRGELFFDESVQKILKWGGLLSQFTHHVKYPRSYHLPWTDSITDDDRTMTSLQEFEEAGEVVVTLKMDGENTTMYSDHIHARSLDSKHHISRDWVKNFHSQIAHEIPEGWRICGENLWAEHSIHYDALETFFMGFSIWDEFNRCLPWDETLEWFELLGIVPVEVLYRGKYDQNGIHSAFMKNFDLESNEGYVIRVADGFHYKDFRNKVGKYVRTGHIQTQKHWFFGAEITRNDLK